MILVKFTVGSLLHSTASEVSKKIDQTTKYDVVPVKGYVTLFDYLIYFV